MYSLNRNSKFYALPSDIKFIARYMFCGNISGVFRNLHATLRIMTNVCLMLQYYY